MLGMTKRQLLSVIETRYMNDDVLVTEKAMQNLFNAYGDEYFRDYDERSPYELCRENEAWKNHRGEKGVPKKGHHAYTI